MSTTFEVYPSTKSLPTYADIILLSSRLLSNFLHKHNIDQTFKINVGLHRCITHEKLPFNVSMTPLMDENQYAWFYVENIDGGCDTYCYPIDELTLQVWEEDFLTPHAKFIQQETAIRQCLQNSHYWCFRRSAGQPAIINLAYGLIAAAFAELTDGFIISSDSAWEYELFPTKADVFIQEYFNPRVPNDYGEWAQRCINSLAALG